MSHTTTIETKFTDRESLIAACERLGWKYSTDDTITLYDKSVHQGFVVRLPEWLYPVIINTKTGEAKADNYQEHWGKNAVMHQLKQQYATEVTRRQLRRQGFRVSERRQDGKVVLTATK